MKRADANDILKARGPDALRGAFDAAFDKPSKPRQVNGEANPKPKPGIRATRWVFKNAASIPPREFLGGSTHYIRKRVSADIAAGASGKSSNLRTEALGMVVGRNLFTGTTFEPLRVWFHAGEDDRDEVDRGFAATCLHYGITEADIGDRLFVDSGKDMPVVIAFQRRGDVEIATPIVEALMSEIRANKIDVLMVDPLVKYHRVSENANEAVEAVINEFGHIAEACNISVALAHHARKLNGNEISAEDARGGGALIAAARSVRTLRHMTPEEAAKADVKADERKLYFRIDGSAKANLTPPSSVATWRRMVSVHLGNGRPGLAQDSVGVVVSWQWPDAFAGLTVEHLKEVQRKVGGGEWRESVQASDWVGKAVADALDLDLDDPASKQRVKTMLKTWTDTGALKVVERPDITSRTRKWIEVGTWAT